MKGFIYIFVTLAVLHAAVAVCREGEVRDTPLGACKCQKNNWFSQPIGAICTQICDEGSIKRTISGVCTCRKNIWYNEKNIICRDVCMEKEQIDTPMGPCVCKSNNWVVAETNANCTQVCQEGAKIEAIKLEQPCICRKNAWITPDGSRCIPACKEGETKNSPIGELCTCMRNIWFNKAQAICNMF